MKKLKILTHLLKKKKKKKIIIYLKHLIFYIYIFILFKIILFLSINFIISYLKIY